jgi:hypothetical protein
MISQLPKHMGNFYYGAVVEPSPELGSVQVPDGTLMPAGELGPGVVKEIAGDDRIKVRWEGPDVEVWMEPGELSSLGPNAHLITIFRCDEHGQLTLLRRRVVTFGGLTYNWMVELLPDNVVRTVRSDGSAWTFDWNPLLGRMETLHTVGLRPPRDDDAEALTVAEIAVPV